MASLRSQQMTGAPTPLPGQYIISQKSREVAPDGFEEVTVGNWNIVYDDQFIVLPITTENTYIGSLIGTIHPLVPRPQNRGRTVIRDGALAIGNDVSSAPIETAIQRIGSLVIGRYIGVIDRPEGTVVFTDPAGALPVVYHTEEQYVAASPLSIPTVTHDTHFRSDLFDAMQRPGSSWIPGTLTYYQDVDQLLPNHYLKLDSFETGRFWPTDTDDLSSESPDDRTIGHIAGTLEAVLDSVLDRYESSAMGLTAGKDSRCLLAAMGERAFDGVSFFTYEGEHYRGDKHIARRIARKLDLDWRSIPVVEATEAERDRYRSLTGYSVGTSVKAIYPTLHEIDVDARIVGLGGEIGRGYYWRITDDARTELDGGDLLERFQKPAHPEVAVTLDGWLNEVDDLDTYATLDLAYQEHRLGCWGGPQHLGMPVEVDVVPPFCYLPVIEALHRLPPDERRFDRMPLRVIDRSWGELNTYPYNSYSGLARWRNFRARARMVKAAITNPTKAQQFLLRKYSPS